MLFRADQELWEESKGRKGRHRTSVIKENMEDDKIKKSGREKR
jgi:hypothetical protein